jgi:hypothetical protein
MIIRIKNLLLALGIISLLNGCATEGYIGTTVYVEPAPVLIAPYPVVIYRSYPHYYYHPHYVPPVRAPPHGNKRH